MGDAQRRQLAADGNSWQCRRFRSHSCKKVSIFGKKKYKKRRSSLGGTSTSGQARHTEGGGRSGWSATSKPSEGKRPALREIQLERDQIQATKICNVHLNVVRRIDELVDSDSDTCENPGFVWTTSINDDANSGNVHQMPIASRYFHSNVPRRVPIRLIRRDVPVFLFSCLVCGKSTL